jgi:DNA-binding CsgD family transcriptional regulator
MIVVPDSWCPGSQPCPAGQLPRRAEPGDVAGLGDDHGGQDRADARQLPDHQIARMAGQQVTDHLIEHRDLGAQLADQLPQQGDFPCIRLGQLLKDRVSQVAVLIDTVERVVAGECVVDPSIVARLVSRTGLTEPLSVLTPREREVLGLMAEGRTNIAIGRRLFLSERTVEGNVRRIFDKLGLADTPQDNRRVLAVLAFLRA